jgi:hypothetical protein
VSEESFPVTLGGKTWALPHLPFRLVKKIQPALFRIYREAGGSEMSSATLARLEEPQLDCLAQATFLAISAVDPNFKYDEFLALPFTVAELIGAFGSLARAAGLRAAASEGSPPEEGGAEKK